MYAATQKLLQIILLGQPELREILDRAELRQLAQRITRVVPLIREELPCGEPCNHWGPQKVKSLFWIAFSQNSKRHITCCEVHHLRIQHRMSSS